MTKKIIKALMGAGFLLAAGLTLLPICYIVTRAGAEDIYRVLLEELWFYPKFWYSF